MNPADLKNIYSTVIANLICKIKCLWAKRFSVLRILKARTMSMVGWSI